MAWEVVKVPTSTRGNSSPYASVGLGKLCLSVAACKLIDDYEQYEYVKLFKDKINKESKDEHLMAKRCIDWKRGLPYTYKIDDYQELMNSPAFFARKFSTKVDKEIIDKIYTSVKGKKK